MILSQVDYVIWHSEDKEAYLPTALHYCIIKIKALTKNSSNIIKTLLNLNYSTIPQAVLP